MDDDKGSKSGSAYVFSIHFPPCDASSPPANGAVGDCTSVLESGTTCQPVCDPGYAVSGPSVCEDGVLSPAVCIPPCDASAPPANGGVGDCTNELMSGTTCQPTCDVGYAASGPSTCEDGVLSPAVCIPPCDASAPPANGGVGDCTNELISGTTCQPTCDVGYAASGPSTCEDGVFSPAVCIGVLHLVADDITDVDSSNLVQSWSDHTGNGLSLSSFVAAPELVDGGRHKHRGFVQRAQGCAVRGVRHHRSEPADLGAATFDFPRGDDRRRGDEHGQSGCHSSDPVRPREREPRGFGCDISPARVQCTRRWITAVHLRQTPRLRLKTGRCTSSPLSTSSRKAASAGTNSRRLSTAIYPTRTSSP